MIIGTNIKKGEPVTYVKITDPIKALPLKMFGENDNASMEWVVPEKFNAVLEQCEMAFGKKICMVDVTRAMCFSTSILNPILEPLDLEFEEKKGSSAKKNKASTNKIKLGCVSVLKNKKKICYEQFSHILPLMWLGQKSLWHCLHAIITSSFPHEGQQPLPHLKQYFHLKSAGTSFSQAGHLVMICDVNDGIKH